MRWKAWPAAAADCDAMTGADELHVVPEICCPLTAMLGADCAAASGAAAGAGAAPRAKAGAVSAVAAVNMKKARLLIVASPCSRHPGSAIGRVGINRFLTLA